jgi:hypothetical protein
MAFTAVTACWLAEPPVAALYTGGFDEFVTWLAAPIATGWSESCRVGLAPTEDRRLVAAHPTEPFPIGGYPVLSFAAGPFRTVCYRSVGPFEPLGNGGAGLPPCGPSR